MLCPSSGRRLWRLNANQVTLEKYCYTALHSELIISNLALISYTDTKTLKGNPQQETDDFFFPLQRPCSCKFNTTDIMWFVQLQRRCKYWMSKCVWPSCILTSHFIFHINAGVWSWQLNCKDPWLSTSVINTPHPILATAGPIHPPPYLLSITRQGNEGSLEKPWRRSI